MLADLLLLALATLSVIPPLPQRLDAFSCFRAGPLSIAPGDRELYNEYDWQTACRAEYTGADGRRMTVDAFRFADSEGARAAYLCSRPDDFAEAVSGATCSEHL
jgi:hypothetical protein